MSGIEMYQDTDSADLPRGAPLNRRKRMFVPEFKLGDIMVVLSILGGGLTAFNTLDKKQELASARITVLEERQREQEQRARGSLIELKADVKTVQTTLNDIKTTMVVRGGGK
jgi:hypothetical protein